MEIDTGQDICSDHQVEHLRNNLVDQDINNGCGSEENGLGNEGE